MHSCVTVYAKTTRTTIGEYDELVVELRWIEQLLVKEPQLLQGELCLWKMKLNCGCGQHDGQMDIGLQFNKFLRNVPAPDKSLADISGAAHW